MKNARGNEIYNALALLSLGLSLELLCEVELLLELLFEVELLSEVEEEPLTLDDAAAFSPSLQQ